MKKKFLLFEGKGHGREETATEVLNLSRRVHDDFYGENYPFQTLMPKKQNRPVFPQKHLWERRSGCHIQF